MSERRQLKRYELITMLRVFNLEQQNMLGYLFDVSSEGLMVLTESPVDVGKDYTLEIRLQNKAAMMYYEDGEEKRISFRAQSRWSSSQFNPPYYSNGFMIIDTTPSTAICLSYMIRKLSKKHRLETRNKILKTGS